jgi:hypothetical protein
MTDTPQPETAGETVADQFESAADAFKTFSTDVPETPERPRGPDGKFVKTEEIEAEAEEESDAEAESQEETSETEEAAEEAQPEVELPPSWPADLAEEWQTLPAPVREKIVAREAEREAAVNAKFQEAANVRKANEAVITEANNNRQKFAEAADVVLGLIQPQRPPISMLNPQSGDYNPDAYHLAQAEYERGNEIIAHVKQQREEALAQLQREAEASERQALEEIEARTRPLLLKDVPDLADAQKQGPAIQSLVQYAIAQGIPEYVFTDPEIAKGVTSAQLHLTWKAQQYDKMKAAQGKVAPKAAKPSAPPVRPGVATSQSAVEAASRKKVLERLSRDGSIEAGAAAFKLFT